MTTLLWLSLAALLALPLMAFAIVFATGCVLGVVSYHLSRQVVVNYQPMRKAFDPEKEKLKQMAVARQMQKEIDDLQKSYLTSAHLTREQYLAAESKQ